MTSERTAAQTPFFSVVIPTLNEEQYLPRLLKNLASQTNQSFEVIHIDGSSEDRTVSEADSFQEQLPITTKVVKKRNVSYQRNTGARLAQGKWLLFMDADTQIPPFFLDGIKYQLAKHPDTDLFTTWVKTDDSSRVSLAIERTINFAFELYKSIDRPAAMGALLGVRRALFKKVSFDETQRFAEDAKFLNDLNKLGHTYSIFHEPRYTFSLRRLRKEGTLKTAGIMAVVNLRFLQGKEFTESDYGYVMQGGSYYDDENSFTGLFSGLQSFIKTASKKQIAHARSLWKSLKELQ